jgi:hypothetical protein
LGLHLLIERSRSSRGVISCWRTVRLLVPVAMIAVVVAATVTHQLPFSTSQIRGDGTIFAALTVPRG